ncbi:MAG: heme-binding protein, partial [Planctomycetaceae bacterium]|nr:heme-binding protein [Planctomycetaceae bacterium]
GPAQYTTAIDVPAKKWFESEAWLVDELVRPEGNPWGARTRITGMDFYPDGKSLAACTWDGDIWKVEGINTLGQPDGSLRWHRIATGLFQPLGILVDKGRLLVTCRDQIVSLGDNNGDGEMDDYRCLNSDHQVTEHFHEFAMGLQRDDEGNLYYAKSARHALKAVVPHHGTLLRVAADGSKTDIIATGFRAANGVCLNDDGSFIVTDQEGHWNPKNRINWVRPGGFYGNMYGY